MELIHVKHGDTDAWASGDDDEGPDWDFFLIYLGLIVGGIALCVNAERIVDWLAA